MTETESNGNGTAAAASVPMAEPPSDLEVKIIKQVEFYFGDINLAKDKFMQEQIKLEEGWIPMETMLKFNRLASISDKPEVIAAAIKKSKTGLMEINEDGTKIRRSPDKPLPENTKDRAQDLKQRTIYAKGFPQDASLDQLQDWFEKEFGVMDHVQMRRMKNRDFKGSVFAVFTKQEDAKKFLTAETVKYGENTIEKRVTKDEYFKIKGEERKQQREEEQQKREEAKKKREQDEEEKFKERIVHGAVLHITGLKEGLRIEDLKQIFGECGTVVWVDYEQNLPEAKVRFSEENGAMAAVEKLKEMNDGKAIIKDVPIETRVLEGEEEEQYWKKSLEDQKERRNRKQGRGFRGGRGGKRGHRGGDDRGHAKRAKTGD